jgi:hypothetical protein
MISVGMHAVVLLPSLHQNELLVRICSTQGETRRAYTVWIGILRRKCEHVKDISVDGRIILKQG